MLQNISVFENEKKFFLNSPPDVVASAFLSSKWKCDDDWVHIFTETAIPKTNYIRMLQERRFIIDLIATQLSEQKIDQTANDVGIKKSGNRCNLCRVLLHSSKYTYGHVGFESNHPLNKNIIIIF